MPATYQPSVNTVEAEQWTNAPGQLESVRTWLTGAPSNAFLVDALASVSALVSILPSRDTAISLAAAPDQWIVVSSGGQISVLDDDEFTARYIPV